MRHLRWDPVHLWLPDSRAGADRFVPVRRGLQLRRHVQLQRLPARQRAHLGDPVMHAGTGVIAVVASVSMTLALVLAWCLAGVRSSRFGYVGAAWYVAHAILHTAS